MHVHICAPRIANILVCLVAQKWETAGWGCCLHGHATGIYIPSRAPHEYRATVLLACGHGPQQIKNGFTLRNIHLHLIAPFDKPQPQSASGSECWLAYVLRGFSLLTASSRMTCLFWQARMVLTCSPSSSRMLLNTSYLHIHHTGTGCRTGHTPVLQ